MYFQTGVSLNQHIKNVTAIFYTISDQNSLFVLVGWPYVQAWLGTAQTDTSISYIHLVTCALSTWHCSLEGAWR